MKFLHYIDELNYDKGSSLFVYELAYGDETILTTFSDIQEKRVKILPKRGKFLNPEKFSTILDDKDFDVFVLHSLKYISPDILMRVKKKNVKIIFISHDYYSICERVNLINNRNMLCSGPYGKNCIYCYLDKFPFLPITRELRDLLLPFFFLFLPRLKWYKRRKEFFSEILSFVDRVIYPSKKSFMIADRFLNLKEKSIVIKNFQRDIRCQKRVKGKYPIFGFIGHSAYHKGLFTVLKSFKEIKSENIKLLLWGDVKTKIKDKRIILKGKFKNDEIEKVLNSFDVLIFPSIWPETSGRVMFEAATCGKIILSSNITPARELLENYENLYLFENRNHISLKMLIEKIIKNWNSKEISKSYKNFYTPDIYRDKIKEVIYDNKN